MHNLKRYPFAAALFVFSINGASAGVKSYQCEILQIHSLDERGKLRELRPKLVLGKRFSVDRDTGKVSGPDAGFPWTFADGTATIASRGSSDNNFKVFHQAPAAKGGAHTTLLQVNESGTEATKTFVAVTGNEVYSGTCQ